MNLKTTITPIAILALALAASPLACGGDPCLPTILADTSIIPAEEMCDDGSTSTTTGDSSTGDMCPVPPIDALICAAVPSAGEMWGPCAEGLSCAPGSTCIVGTAGNVCAPACDDCGCPNLGCFGGTCNAENGCAPACIAVGDPCPAPGMQCAPDAGACVWPVAEVCAPKTGEAWGPCDNGACKDGSLCVGVATADICAMPCDGGNPCAADVCIMEAANLPTCGGTSLGDVCLYQCTGITDCAAGQTCTVDGCLWAK